MVLLEIEGIVGRVSRLETSFTILPRTLFPFNLQDSLQKKVYYSDNPENQKR